MTFEEQFLNLAIPFFELIEPGNEASETTFDRYYDVHGRIEPLKVKLADLAKGDQGALRDLLEFFSDESVTEFFNHDNSVPFLKVLSLASNITADTWIMEATEVAPVRAIFLLGDNRIHQPHSASGNPLTYFFFNSDEISNSIALIDFRDDPNPDSLGAPESWAPMGQDLIEAWAVILLLENIADVDGCLALISSEASIEKALSYLKYHLVMGGNKLTLPMPLPASNAMLDIQKQLAVAIDYTQFVEPFAMLSEVNSCEHILDTFLSTYHVLENYMIRSEVSAVLSNSTGQNFQRVRDFKRLGHQTDASEISHLTNLFRKCWEIRIGVHELQTTLMHSFEQARAEALWDDDEFDGFLVQLGVLNSKGAQITLNSGFNNDDDIRRNFAKLVYGIRCSIVHNKATEFHLSNEELRRKGIRSHVIVKICLPVMTRLAFGLPSSLTAMNPIYYSRRELRFY